MDHRVNPRCGRRHRGGRDRDHDRHARSSHRGPGSRGRPGGREGAPADRCARWCRADQRLGSADPALGPGPAQGRGGQVMLTVAALSNHGAWEIALVIGLVAALAVAGLLWVLIQSVDDIERSATGLLEVAGKVAGNTAHIPELQATAPVLGQIVDEAIVQDGYMNALTDGFGSAA